MIYLGTDHAGFALKEVIKIFLDELGLEYKDFGAKQFDKDDDYPDFISPVALEVSEDKSAKGIIFGGSGQGEAMVANRVRGIRAIVYYGGNLEIIKLSRQHNDANILSLGARFLSEEEAKETVKLWLKTEFSQDARHIRRISKF